MKTNEEFDQKAWDAGWKAAKAEHKTGHPCSQNYIGSDVDFRNGMTAYRDEHDLLDDKFDMPENHRSEKPILFSGPMVQAIMDGRKTQTRRVIDEQKCLGYPHHEIASATSEDFTTTSGLTFEWKCPYGRAGDRLSVRERWGLWAKSDLEKRDPALVVYAVNPNETRTPLTGQRWRPSIYMPRWASRLTLEMVKVRVERLQDISEADAKAEGIDCRIHPDQAGLMTWRDYHIPGRYAYGSMFGPRESFESLWNSLNAKRGFGWEKNPWVWVVEFKKL